MSSAFPPVDEQMQRIRRGADDVFPEDELRKKLEKSRESGTPLRIKLGVDPTAPDLTLGNAVPLWKLRAFQDLGHVAVLIIGDYTAQVGDPSGRNSLRPMLTEQTVAEHAQTYLDQLDRILLPERLEVRRNGEWFSEMSFMEVMQLAGRMTVAQMLERDDFEKRYREQQPISVHEFLYPLMQGWDSVMVRSDVELGGTDQRFNLIVGRDMQRSEGQAPQAIVINPLVPGTDGVVKMSKSYGNYVGVTESPGEQFGKCMSVPDTMLRPWLTCFTDVDEVRIDELCDAGRTHPREAKEAMAKGVVARYWGAAAADEAAAEFKRVFAQGQLPDDMPEASIAGDGIAVLDLLTNPPLAFAKSRGEARRLIKQGAVKIDDTRVDDPDLVVTIDGESILRCGKRRFAKLVSG
jgi:tyrosyl-tRNA synthetase